MLTVDIIDKALEGDLIKASGADATPAQREFFELTKSSNALFKATGFLSALLMKNVEEGFFEGAAAAALIMVFIGYAIAKEEAKEVAVAGAIQ